MSKSDILGPIDHISDIENLVSFERTMLEDYSFKYRIKNIPIIDVNKFFITTLKYIPYVRCTCKI